MSWGTSRCFPTKVGRINSKQRYISVYLFTVDEWEFNVRPLKRGHLFIFSTKKRAIDSALLDARDRRPLVSAASASVRAGRCAVADALTKVVLATGDCLHPAIASFGATAFLV